MCIRDRIQSIQSTVNLVDERSIQFESQSKSKLMSIEQSINNVKDELKLAINRKLSDVSEQLVINRDSINALITISLLIVTVGGTLHVVFKPSKGY